jgi:hypothetical protein
MQGQTPDQIAGIEAAYVRGELPKRDSVSFGYMWSADSISDRMQAIGIHT